MNELVNRLKRMGKHFRKWARRRDIHAYRIYDRDLPQFPFAVDIYEDCLSINEFVNDTVTSRNNYEEWRSEVIKTFRETLDFPEEKVFIRKRERQKGEKQYSRNDYTNRMMEVREGGLKFLVNLNDYLDTGLFLDHRPLRGMVREEAKGKRFLNLFCYTGSFTVYAAAGGASSSVSVDTSANYLDWLENNLRLNDLSGPQHETARMDSREFLESYKGPGFDLVVCDPPVFSTGKKLKRDFDVLRDHPELIDACLGVMNPGGKLYFSTNFRKFKIRWTATGLQGDAKEITAKTIPDDFRNKKIHTCYEIVKG